MAAGFFGALAEVAEADFGVENFEECDKYPKRGHPRQPLYSFGLPPLAGRCQASRTIPFSNTPTIISASTATNSRSLITGLPSHKCLATVAIAPFKSTYKRI